MEALYLRMIPVVKKCIAMGKFYGFPCVFGDDWGEVAEEFLHHRYEITKATIMLTNYTPFID